MAEVRARELFRVFRNLEDGQREYVSDYCYDEDQRLSYVAWTDVWEDAWVDTRVSAEAFRDEIRARAKLVPNSIVINHGIIGNGG